MTTSYVGNRTLPGRLVIAAACLLLLPILAAPTAAQEDRRIGDDVDPVLGAIAISRESHPDGTATHAVIGRSDVFADNLAATALLGQFGTLLLTTGGPDRALRPEVLDELIRALGERTCEPDDPSNVYLAGGASAVSEQVAQAISEAGYCVRRVGGSTRVETAIAIADVVGGPSDTVIVARSDDWADAAAVGSYAARTNSRVLVTPTAGLDDGVAAAIRAYAPAEILLMGGTAALSSAVEQAAAQIAPVRRIQGPTRDATAAAIAEEAWGGDASGSFAIGHGYAGAAWAYLFAAAPLAGRLGLPILYADDDGPTAVSQQVLAAADPAFTIPVGPAVPPDEAPRPAVVLDRASVALQSVGGFNSPLVMRPRPDRAELWVAERSGVVRAFGGGPTRVVLDISTTVSTSGERGLLGMAFSSDGARLYTSSTDNGGTSVLDAFDIVGEQVDRGTRRQLLRVGQPASNHNGGDLHLGPDGYLWWSLGDGGGSNDRFGHGQRTDTLLATLVRIDPEGGDPYAIPADNPFVAGGGAPEVWAYGLRNPWRFSFDPLNGDLYIGDVGQGAMEEVDYVAAGTGAGSNFGWPAFEGTIAGPDRNPPATNHTPPVWTTTHRAGNCSITGGIVYRGDAIPDLYGAYLYADICNTEIRAILVEDGVVTQDADLGIRIGSPVGFGVDHSGEAYVLSLSGGISKIVPR